MDRYIALLRDIYEEIGSRDAIKAYEMANIALTRLRIAEDTDAGSLSIYTLARLSEKILGQENRGRNDGQGELFILQERYPTKDGYRRLEKMSNNEVYVICGRLRREGTTKIRHARALEDYVLDRGWPDDESAE